MKLKVRDVRGDVVDEIEVRDDVFAAPMNKALVHQVMVGQLANARQGTSATKTRGLVSGGGIKPRPQKGSGRSRQGSIRSPQWKGGGVVFGPQPRSYRHRTPKRMRRLSLVCMLSDKARQERLVVVDRLELERPKTKEMMKVLHDLNADSPVLLVADGTGFEVLRAARNLPKVRMRPAFLLNTLELLNHRTVVMTLGAVREAERLWGGPFVRKAPQRAAEPAAD